MQVKTGILGGTFDPIHIGHIEIAKAAMNEVGLDKVIFMVAGNPWQKSAEGVSNAEDRFAMVDVAVAGIEGFEASDMEIKRMRNQDNTYTIDTLHELAENQAGELFFIIGSDVMGELDTWERPEEVKELATFIILERPNSKSPKINSESQNVKALNIKGPYLDISATDIRQRIKNNQSVESLLPQEVFRIIKERKLYSE